MDSMPCLRSSPSSETVSSIENEVPTAIQSSSQASVGDPGKSLSPSSAEHVGPHPPKTPMREFQWGGDLIRKTLPARIIPAWLDPLHVDVADPRSLPKCWFGVPFVSDLVFGYAERVGLASYYTREVVRAQPGDLDIFETWARLDVWFKEQSGLQLDWVLVWGERFPILTFWSNHELLRITKEMWGQVCDLIDDMGYGPEYVLAWYLDRDLEY
ncbi:hypothetical protein LXA43DRAFT_705921 [Ganoderma leucocontextum]|nr:hypothetical protein LXA43DRAFT_705921 [Ganoderma leucocontextum]